MNSGISHFEESAEGSEACMCHILHRRCPTATCRESRRSADERSPEFKLGAMLATAASGCETCVTIAKGLYMKEIKQIWFHNDGVDEWDHDLQLQAGDQGGGWAMVRVTDKVRQMSSLMEQAYTDLASEPWPIYQPTTLL
jgi:hypothetical protein